MDISELRQIYSDYSVVKLELINADESDEFMWTDIYGFCALLSKHNAVFCVVPWSIYKQMIRYQRMIYNFALSEGDAKVFGVDFRLEYKLESDMMLLVDGDGRTIAVTIK